MTEIEQAPQVTEPEKLGFPTPSSKDVGWLVFGGGVAGALVTLLRRRRSLADWALPVGLIGLGCGILLRRRQSEMEAAQESIRAELDALDPIARAQVLKAVAEDQFARLPGLGSSD